MTQAGIILGTAAYMSPEQARGKPVDKRADIWAFGVVLFEMLTGRRAFEGDDIAITLAAVMMKEPDWRALPAPTPVGLRRLLTRCLKKDPKARMRDIGDARLQIEELLSGAPEEVGVPAIPHALSLWQRALPWASTGALAAGLAAVLVLWAPWRTAPEPARVAFERADRPPNQFHALSCSRSRRTARMSSRRVQDGDVPRLWVRPLARLEGVTLARTDDALYPFWSPDGRCRRFLCGRKAEDHRSLRRGYRRRSPTRRPPSEAPGTATA